MKKYNKAEKEAKAASEFEEKFSARAAFPAAELARAEGNNEGAAAAREARIEARRQGAHRRGKWLAPPPECNLLLSGTGGTCQTTRNSI